MDYDERTGLNKRCVNFTVSAPLTLVEVIDKLAYSEGLRSSPVAVRLLRKGLEVERQERREKQAKVGTQRHLDEIRIQQVPAGWLDKP